MGTIIPDGDDTKLGPGGFTGLAGHKPSEATGTTLSSEV